MVKVIVINDADGHTRAYEANPTNLRLFLADLITWAREDGDSREVDKFAAICESSETGVAALEAAIEHFANCRHGYAHLVDVREYPAKANWWR